MDAKEAIKSCAEEPEKLRGLDPFLFELVVAELLAGFGWEVSVTLQHRLKSLLNLAHIPIPDY